MNPDSTFVQAYSAEVRRGLGNDYRDNFDESRFGPEPVRAKSLARLLKAPIKRFLKGTPFQRSLDFMSPYLPQLERLHRWLADETSRTLLVKLVAYRALGHRKVKLPFNALPLTQGLAQVEALMSRTDFLDSRFMGWKLHKIDLSSLGVPVALYTSPTAAYVQFVAQQYRCDCVPCPIEAAPEDYVIDGGGCWGDTALYFAHKVGPGGRVYTFEFIPSNLAIMKRNFDLNPALVPQIETVERALWNHSGVRLPYREDGPGTRVAEAGGDEGAQHVLTLSIDDLVAQKALPRINFIKMDIEGAELSALKGAEHTLRRLKPKLAISVYHRFEDLFEIADYLQSLGIPYRFFLRHFSIHTEETVLFAGVA